MYEGRGLTVTRDSDNSGLFTVNGTTAVQFCHPTGDIAINLPPGDYTIRNLRHEQNVINCGLTITKSAGGKEHYSDSVFTIDAGDTCIAYITAYGKAGTVLTDVKVGCMLNSGSVALPFSEYTDVAVVK